MNVTLNTLESNLWESANILRGPIDAVDFKTYIFPLFFFKRICDVWDEEYQEIVDETGEMSSWPGSLSRIASRSPKTAIGTTFAPKPPMSVQPCKSPCERSKRLTRTLCMAFLAMPSGLTKTDCLKNLIEHFSKLSFSNHNSTPIYSVMPTSI